MATKGPGAEAAPAANAAPEADAFSTAFDQFAVPEKKPGEDAPPVEGAAEQQADADAAKAGTDAEAAAEAAAAAEPKLDAEGKPIVEEPKLDAEGKPIVEAEPAKDLSADDILSKLSKMVKEAPAPAEGPKLGADGKPIVEAAPEEKPIYTEEETTFLADYDKEWGDVVKGEALKRRAEYKELLGYVFQQVAEFIRPIQQTTELLAGRTHLADIETQIPDYSDQLRDDVTEWVKTQPAYLQAAYNQVITEGTVDEVKDLVDRYRGATGKAAPAPEAKLEPKPNGKDNELSGDAKKAAAALAPVESKRSGVQQQADPSDFDDAWAQAAKALEAG